LHERIKQVERVLLVDVVEKMVERGLTVNGRLVSFR
jgi:folate-dependent phosphoribosylglycinamide formyltransferase PurN